MDICDGRMVVGKPFTDLPAWSYDPAVQQRLRAAIAQANRGETVCFEARIHPRADLYLDMAQVCQRREEIVGIRCYRQ